MLTGIVMTDSFWTAELLRPGLCAGIMVGILAAFYGVFVVQRGLSFLSAGLSHAAFAGIALGLVLGLAQPMWVAVPYMLLLAIILTFFRQQTGVRHDTLIGIAFSASMALGLILLQYQTQLNADAMSYLFGDLIFVRWSDVWLAAMLFIVTIVLLPLWGRWAYASFDEDLAAADRNPVKRDEYILIIMMALLVAVSVKIAGIILTSALFVIPPAAARLLARHFTQMTLYAVAFGALSVLLGMYLSYQADWPCGASVVLVQTICFLIAAAIRPRS